MSKPVILHFIYNLGIGGAEKMLMDSIEYLQGYEHTLVTLDSKNEFKKSPFKRIFNLNCNSTLKLPLAIVKFKRILKHVNPVLVHSHLPLPNIIAKFSTPTSIPLLIHIHTTASKSIAYSKFHIRVLERISNRYRRFNALFVSQSVMADYWQLFKLNPDNCFVLNTYADETIFRPSFQKTSETHGLKMVTIGQKESKNVKFILKGLIELNDPRVFLDVYGSGKLPELANQVKSRLLPVEFKGQVANLENELPQYDLYISASQFEGFSLSVLEAMACKLPLLLSDIPSFREQAENTAFYFDLNDLDQLIGRLRFMIENPEILALKADESYQRFLSNYTLAKYLARLRKIYDDQIKLKKEKC